MIKIFAVFFLTFFASINSSLCASSDWQNSSGDGAKTRLVASFYEKNGEKKLITGLEFKINDGWKIYGNDSSGIGLPPSFDFSGSNNYKQHEISWPQAQEEEEQIGSESLKYSTYKNHVIIPIAIDLSDLNSDTNLTLKLDYGLCKDVCIPVSQNFSLKVLPEIDEETLQKIQKFYAEKISKDIEASPEKTKSISLISVIIIAIIGGAILNIMPCVLPILSIKLLSIINHSNTSISRIRFAFLSTILGILSCFLVLAILAALIKLSGNSLGWGLQFQNPYFLISLILILVFFIANLLGIFEINFSQLLASFLNKKISDSEQKQNIFIPNFLSGILAVMLATPCSAPFLGSAISFGLTQDFSTIFVIFFAIGLGFALPYFILLIAPKLVYLLPKPGNWMIRFKQVLAGLMAATIIWLAYVLSHNIGTIFALSSVVLAVMLLGCFKIKSDLLRYLAFIIVITSTIYLPSNIQEHQLQQMHEKDSIWGSFDEAKIYAQVAKGNTVIIDITADWCITCKFNKLRVFHNAEVMKKLGAENIILMRGDITKPNEEIMNYLRRNNRFAIPFNAVYGPNAKTGLITSELLSKSELLELIEKAQ